MILENSLTDSTDCEETQDGSQRSLFFPHADKMVLKESLPYLAVTVRNFRERLTTVHIQQIGDYTIPDSLK